MVIESYDDSKLDAIVRLSLRAWEPVFKSLRDAMGSAVYRAFYRDDWRVAQRRAVESVCSDKDMHVWVASEQSKTAGFVALKLHPEDRMGEIYMIAVDPDFQRRGIATSLSYIMHNGGQVQGAVTLTGRLDSAKLALQDQTLEALREKHGQEIEDWWRQSFGYGFDGLTESEARYLLRAEDAHTIRTKLSEAGSPGHD